MLQIKSFSVTLKEKTHPKLNELEFILLENNFIPSKESEQQFIRRFPRLAKNIRSITCRKCQNRKKNRWKPKNANY